MSNDDAILSKAHAVLARVPVIDGHNDLLWEARGKVGYDWDRLDVAGSCADVHTDIPRIREGRLGAQFWSVYVPSDLPGDAAVTATLEQIDALHGLVARYPDTFELARTADDVERVTAAGRVASMIGVEGGQSIGSSLGALRVLAHLGARYMTLTHNHNTPWADSATDEPKHGGLTKFGEEVVREMNRLGVLVDLSHVSADTMRHAIDVSEAPVIFSHSNARALCDVTRNIPDDVLAKVPSSRGVVMVTFVPVFLTAEGAKKNAAGWEEARRLQAEHGDDRDAIEAAMKTWFESNPDPTATASDVADHVDYVRDTCGIEHIGIGGDYDGSMYMPTDMPDVSSYPVLFAELLRRGYSEEDLALISQGNILRAMREAEEVAARLQRERPPSLARFPDFSE
jgi:membrane dipeptidase